MSRRVLAKIIIKGIDHEYWPERDEHIRREYSFEQILDLRNPAFDFEVPAVRWGDECRVEVDLTGKLVNRGNVEIEATARLYEGTTENTDDLDDEETITFTVPPGRSPVHRKIHLENTETLGGDTADIGLSFTNTLVEE